MNGATAVAVALSLVSAVAYASAAVAQERLAARTAPGTGVLTLLTRGAWWWAVGLNAAGALLHVVALTYGPLTVVQPLGALTLVAAVPLGARRAGRQVSRGEWRGTAFTLVGLAAILLTAAGSSPDETLSLPQALGVAGVALALVALLTRPGAGSGLRHAAASGIISGVASALTQTVTVAATARDADALPIWQVAAVALVVATFASGGLLLSQRAYRGGLGAPLAVLTLANPLAAAVIGLTLLGERLQGGALGVTAALLGAVVAARGVVLLTRTAVTAPAMPAATAEVPMAQLPGQRSAVRAAMSPTRPDLGGHTMEPAAMEPAAMEPAAVGPGVGVPAQGAPARDPFAARPSWRPHPLRSRRALRERRRARRRGDCTYR
ncbi:hypothetical protein ACFXKS_01220 [Streptomyces scopuliridis]|uniref:hypothetical protein n=1 Tax=Streptomyces scopuliridis TaxID=452529 RepID=UPI003692A2E2